MRAHTRGVRASGRAGGRWEGAVSWACTSHSWVFGSWPMIWLLKTLLFTSQLSVDCLWSICGGVRGRVGGRAGG